MKYLMLGAMVFLSSYSFAETLSLPDATMSRSVIGGDILLIKMKAYVVISGEESRALESELGMEAKKQFTQDIVMSKSIRDLIVDYNSSNNRNTVQLIIERYSNVLTQLEAKSRLN